LSTLRAISWPLLFWSGLFAYIGFSWLLILLRVLGLTRYVPRTYWAARMFGNTRGFAMFGGRALRAFALIVLIPLPYVLAFEIVGNADLRFGVLLGLIHGAFVGLTLPLIAGRAPQGTLEPGFFGYRLGAATPLLILITYAFYGAILGYVYVIPSP
jgi:hypothetical protein